MLKFDNKFIINVAFTGAVSDKDSNPAVPYTVEEIVSDAAACAAAGAAVGHFHVRTKSGQATNDPARYAELFRALRSNPATSELILVASTSGRHGQTLQERAAVLDLPMDARPDMALSSLNFSSGPSVNHPDEIIALAQRMQENGIVPELEVFDLGMVAYLNHLIGRKILTGALYVNAILGIPAGAQADALTIGTLLAHLPQDTILSLGGVGRWQLPAHLFALAQANGLRTGLEDNLRSPGGKSLTTNEDLVKHAAELARMSARPLMTPQEFRAAVLSK